MPQFVLIDQSIRGLTGHHYEYAVHVLRAAEKAGYQPILAANRGFTGQGEKHWLIYREYEFGFWSEPRKQQLSRPKVEWIRRIWFLGRCKLRFSALGLAWVGRTDWAKYVSRKPRGLAGFLTHALGLLLIVATKVLCLAGLLLLLPFWAVTLPLLAVRELLGLLVRPPLFQRYVRAFVLELRTYAEFAKALARSAGFLRGAAGKERLRGPRGRGGCVWQGYPEPFQEGQSASRRCSFLAHDFSPRPFGVARILPARPAPRRRKLAFPVSPKPLPGDAGRLAGLQGGSREDKQRLPNLPEGDWRAESVLLHGLDRTDAAV